MDIIDAMEAAGRLETLLKGGYPYWLVVGAGTGGGPHLVAHHDRAHPLEAPPDFEGIPVRAQPTSPFTV